MELIAVIMKGATSAQRFEDAQTLLKLRLRSYALRKDRPETGPSAHSGELGAQATVQPVLGEGARC